MNKMSASKGQNKIFDSKSVIEAYLLKKRPPTTIVYAYPSILLYVAWLLLKLFFFEDTEEGELDYGVLSIILIIGAHAVSYLSCSWNPKISKKLQHYEVYSPEEATTLMVVPKKHHGSVLFCDVVKGDASGDGSVISVNYQSRKYVYDHHKKIFSKMEYPDKETFDLKWIENYKGITEDTESPYWKYGRNVCNVPVRSFADLFMEHTTSPLFVFQIFSVMLWILDGMINYSLYVLTALVIFESIIVTQRLKTMREFQSMTTKPYNVNVCRNNKWVSISSSELLPYDLVSISSNQIDKSLTADMLLINGSCLVDEAIMTGESTPQVKEGVTTSVFTDSILPRSSTFSLVHGGTTVLQVSHLSRARSENEPPDGGIKALVIRTGFSTKQGKLIKKIIFNNDKVSLENTESLLFIALLLFFALIASVYVWIQGNKDDTRKKSAILLDCVLIIVSAVPPELPTEISLSVNNSLAALTKNFIFCMEPFRIPYAGKIDVACFDKTGTLTESDLYMEGVVLPGDKGIVAPNHIPDLHKKLLATAQSVVVVGNRYLGDPMEKNTMRHISWKAEPGNIVSPQDSSRTTEDSAAGRLILRRFQFSSVLKRMSAISVPCSSLKSVDPLIPCTGKMSLLVSCKGAPEVLEAMLDDKPKNYADMYKHWVKKGRRVLAFAYKTIELEGVEHTSLDKFIATIKRQDAESHLKFAGLLVFSCPLKPDAKASIKKIMNSSHRVVIITGDNVFTACHVAKELDIVTDNMIIADIWSGQKPSWKTIDERLEFPIDPQEHSIDSKLYEYDMCISGRALKLLHGKPWMSAYCPRLWVYARISPSQKEDIMIALKSKGYYTMMCGDGTNDMGALKCSHVGVAILNGSLKHLEKAQMREAAIKQIKALEQQEKVRTDLGLGGLSHKNKEKLIKLREDAGIKPGVSLLKAEESIRNKSRTSGGTMSAEAIMGEIFHNLDDDDSAVIKPGDASVAAPFTSKASCIDNIVKVLCQGRATLVAILQTYKILALSCMVSAFTISSLSLSGVRQNDIQSTIAGIATTSCFYGISRSKLLDTLSKQRPQSKAFGSYVLTSIVGQAAIHIAAFIFVRIKALQYSEEDGEDEELPDGDFYPNLLNTSIYLISLVTQIATFVVNYQGHPFRQSIRNNKPLWNATIFSIIFVLVCMCQVSEGLNKSLQLVPFSEGFRNILISTSVLDILGAWLVEKVSLRLLSDAKARPELFPREQDVRNLR